MVYKNAETYLNEEFRKPILEELKGVDEEKVAKTMEIVDYLCDKYREVNGSAMFFNKKVENTPELFKEYTKFMCDNGYFRPIDYNSLEDEEFYDEVLEEEKWSALNVELKW